MGASVYLASEALAAKALPGYSYLYNYLSDLGVATVVNVGFVVHGALFAVGAVVVTHGAEPVLTRRGFVAAAAVNALGNVVIAVFPSYLDTKVPWHGIGAGLAIIGGNLALVVGGGAGRWSWCRSVYPIIVWELVTAVVLLAGRSR